MDTYDNNSTNYKIVGGNNANSDACHELKKWSEVSSVDKISSPVKPGREDNKHHSLDNTKRRSSNCNNDTNNNNNDNNHLPWLKQHLKLNIFIEITTNNSIAMKRNRYNIIALD